MSGRGTDFFISHAGRDTGWAEWLAWQLQQAGYRVELDVWDWAPGEDFVARMAGALERADRVLAVCTEAYFSSTFGGAELPAAFAQQSVGRIVPMLVEPVILPALYATLIHADLTGLDEAAAAARLRVRLGGARLSRRIGVLLLVSAGPSAASGTTSAGSASQAGWIDGEGRSNRGRAGHRAPVVRPPASEGKEFPDQATDTSARRGSPARGVDGDAHCRLRRRARCPGGGALRRRRAARQSIAHHPRAGGPGPRPKPWRIPRRRDPRARSSRR